MVRATAKPRSGEIVAVLSASTFRSFIREFSPLEVCAGESKMTLWAGFLSLPTSLGPAQWFAHGHRADLGFAMASEAATPDLLASGD